MSDEPLTDTADLEPDPPSDPDLAAEPDPALAIDDPVTLGEAENSPEDAVQAQAEEFPPDPQAP